MAFEKGHTKIPGSGNLKGSVTTKNIVAREFLSGENCPISNSVKILKESAELSDNERLSGWIKLIEYVASKLKSIEHKGDTSGSLVAQIIRDVSANNKSEE